MMSIKNVDAKYAELRARAELTGCDALILVIELHVPSEHLAYSTYRPCSGCVGTIQGDEPSWPEDCTTTQVIAGALRVVLE
jgi:hypothetical protein